MGILFLIIYPVNFTGIDYSTEEAPLVVDKREDPRLLHEYSFSRFLLGLLLLPVFFGVPILGQRFPNSSPVRPQVGSFLVYLLVSLRGCSGQPRWLYLIFAYSSSDNSG